MKRSTSISEARLRLHQKHDRTVSADLEGASPKRTRAGKQRTHSWPSVLLAALSGIAVVQVFANGLVKPQDLSEGISLLTPSQNAPRPVRRRKEIDVRPPTRSPSAVQVSQNFLAYFPHSGYHNQRISLENAFTLAYMLNRTLLVPPARLGNAIPYISFDKLYLRTNQATKTGLEHCKHTGSVLPRECVGFHDWTTVSWDFLVDFDHATSLVPVVDRWNGTYEWLEEQYGIKEDAIFSVPDERMYQFRIYDTLGDDAPLDKFEKRIDIDSLRQLTDYKLLHVGTLFGTSRLRTVQDDNGEARSLFRKSMVFRNPLVDRITDAICERLGGPAGYYGLHLRVGDGEFLKQAGQNAKGVLRRLLESSMHLEPSLVDEVLQKASEEADVGSTASRLQRRDLTQEEIGIHTRGLSAQTFRPLNPARLGKRANSRPQKHNAYHHAALPSLPIIRDRANSPLDSSLTCRGQLYQDERFLKLNAPVFLATDSRQPTSDPNLAVLFDVLPCLFVLGDFAARQPTTINAEPIAELIELDELVNAEDGVSLAQFLYPIIDMVSAAKGRAIIGTPSSTFSRFAVDVLHQVYHGWDIIERG